MEKDYLLKDESKKKAGAESFNGDVTGLMPPELFKFTDSEDFDKVKKGIPHLKEMKDYFDLADAGISNIDIINKKTFFRQGSEGVFKKKFGIDTQGGDPFGKAGKALDYAEIGVSMYDMLHGLADENQGKVYENAINAGVNTIGMMGPIGAAFGAGYELGSFVDKHTGLSKEIYDSTDLKDEALENSFDAKLWKLERAKKEQLLNAEKKGVYKSLLITTQNLEVCTESFVSSLSQVLASYPNDHVIAEFASSSPKPKVDNVTSFKSIGDQTSEMVMQIPELESYNNYLLAYNKTLLRLMKIALRESKRHNLGNKTMLKPTENVNDKIYKKYNEEGNILEEGIVKVNKKGKIIGGSNINFISYDKFGVQQEKGTFDFDKKGRKKNEKTTKIFIY